MRIIDKGIRFGNVDRRLFASGDLAAYLQRSLRCLRYYPTHDLETALAKYGHIEFYADGLAKQSLDHPVLAARFIQNAGRSLGFEDNVRETFAEHRLIVLVHQDGPVAFLESPASFEHLVKDADLDTRARQSEIHQVMSEEIGRDFVASARPALDQLEGNLFSGDGHDSQLLLTQILMGQAVRPDKGKNR
jgi:hypothetical protein